MKKFIALATILLAVSSVSVFGRTKQGVRDVYIFCQAQKVIENMDSLSGMTSISKEDLAFFENMYVIDLKTAKILYTPTFKSSEFVEVTPEMALDIANKTVKSWQADESTIVSDIGEFLSAVVVTNSRDVYVLAIPNHNIKRK